MSSNPSGVPAKRRTAAIQISRRRRRSRRRRVLGRRWFRPIYLVYMFVPIIILVIYFAISVTQAVNDVRTAQNNLETVLDSVENKDATELSLTDYDQINDALTGFINALNSANAITAPIRPLSQLNADLAAQLDLIDAARYTAQGTRSFLTGMRPTVTLLERGGIVENDSDENSSATPSLIGSTGERSVELLQAARGRFVNAEVQLAQANDVLGNIEQSGVSQELISNIRDITDLHDQIVTYNALALDAPEMITILLGLDESQTYLVLAQNNDELRPSGGYISTWGWMQVRNGDVQDYNYFPSTSTTPDPPPSGTLNVEIPDWWFSYSDPLFAAWDGSWYADFYQTAQMSVEYYNNGNNPNTPVQGAIGIDLVAVRYLIDALGDIYLEEYDDTINVNNFRERIYSVRAAGEGLEHKEYVAVMYQEVLESWRSASSEQKANINRALLQALRERHIVVYFEDDMLQSAAEELNWAGRVNIETGQDYLLLADANIGSKSSSSVRRQLTYDVTLRPDGSADSRLSIDYNFSATVAENDPAVAPEHYGTQRDYFTRMQTIVPANAELSRVEGFREEIDIFDGDGYRAFTGQVIVQYDDSERVQFEYSQPSLVQPVGDYQRYWLTLQKQTGSTGDIVNVTVFLPPGAVVLSASPPPNQQYFLDSTVYEYNLTLVQSQSIEIIYSN